MFKVTKNGMCLINLDIILEQSNTYEDSKKENIVGMIDTGATHFAIDETLAKN